MKEARSHWPVALTFATAALVFVQLALFGIQFAFHVRMPLNVFNYCVEWFRHIGFPVRLNAMLFLSLCTAAVSATLVFREALSLRRGRKLFGALGDAALAEELEPDHGLKRGQLVILDHPELVAMTIGLFKPRIVLSTGVLDLLGPGELGAVIAHERYHLRRRHPLAVFLLSLIGASMWYMPIYLWMLNRYKLLIELKADRYAIKATGRPDDLGSAILILLKRGGAVPFVYSRVSFADNANQLRIRHLLNPDAEPTLEWPVLRLLASAVMFAVPHVWRLKPVLPRLF